MRIKWWKRNDPRGIITALVAGPLVAGIWLAGCGGGGGGNNMTTAPGFLLSGTVYAPNRSLSSIAPRAVTKQAVVTRQNAAYGAVPNVPVAVGQVDDNGGGFTSLGQTTTDSLGGYTFSLPAGVMPAPNLVVRATSGSALLENIVTGPIVNVSPETTAATELLYSTAHNRGIGLGRLRLSSITSFITQATTIADNTPAGNTVANAIAIANAAFQSKRYAATITSALAAVLTNVAPPPPVIPGGPTRRPVRPPGRGTPAPTIGGGGTPGATATSSGPPGPPGPPGRATPTPIIHPTGQPTTPPSGQPTTSPTNQPTQGPTFMPVATPTTRPTMQPTLFGPTVTPGPQVTPVTTPTPSFGTTPTPSFGTTPTPGFGNTPTPSPILGRRARRRR